MMKAEYYPKNQIWIVRIDENEVKFPIELVTVELIEYFAKLYDKIGKDVGWEMLSDDDKDELLEWFEKDVFPSKEFGEFLINEIHKEALQTLKENEEESKVVESSFSFSEFLSSVKNSYLNKLSDGFISFLDKKVVKSVENDEIENKLIEVMKEYEEKGELEARLEALSSYDVYAVESLMSDLSKKGVNVEGLDVSKVIDNFKKLFVKELMSK